MKAYFYAAFLLTAFALPAYAGHGTIEETDDVIIVEYTGDAADNQPAKKGEAPPQGQAQQSRQATPPSETVQPSTQVATGDGDGERTAKPRTSEDYEARKKARAEKRAARRGKGLDPGAISVED